jgi:hypothetical protein
MFEKTFPVASQAGSYTSRQMQAGLAPVLEVSADKAINNIRAPILTVVFMISPFDKLFVTLD